MLCGKAGFEPRCLCTKAESYDHCTTYPVKTGHLAPQPTTEFAIEGGKTTGFSIWNKSTTVTEFPIEANLKNHGIRYLDQIDHGNSD